MRGRGVDISEPEVVQPLVTPVTSGRARDFSDGAHLQITLFRAIKTATQITHFPTWLDLLSSLVAGERSIMLRPFFNVYMYYLTKLLFKNLLDICLIPFPLLVSMVY